MPGSSELVEIALKEAEDFYERYHSPLTLRGLFYILVSKNVIPNTRNAYKRLSEVLATARYKGLFPWHLIKDTSRKVYSCEKSTYYPTRPLSPEELKEILINYVESYSDVRVNPWDDQPCRVIITVEKEALGDIIYRFAREIWCGVYQVRVLKGYESATMLHDLAETIKMMDVKKVAVLHLGDYDPSGEDIFRDLMERLEAMKVEKEVVMEKVAVTIDQIIELQLPAKPESIEEIEKLRRDPRYKAYIEKMKELAKKDERIAKLVEAYGSHEVRVELDALVALHPEKLKKVLEDAVLKYFDVEVYEEVTEKKEKELKEKAEEVRKATFESLTKLLGSSD